jgi:hypothetical protein
MIAALSIESLVVHVLVPCGLNVRSRENRTACGALLEPRRRWTTSARTIRDLRMHTCLQCVHALAPARAA